MILAVDVAADQLHAPAAFVVDDGGVDGVVVRAEIETGVDAAGVVGKNVLGLGGGLDRHDLILKIRKRVDIALGIDRDHLAARKVRARPNDTRFRDPSC